MFRVSCIQLKSNNNILHNLKKTEQLISKAVKQKTDFILTPEISSLFSLEKKRLLKICKPMKDDIYLNGIKKIAKKYKRWILIGSLIIKVSKNKLVNRSVLVDKNGRIRTYYDKIHMYDVVLSKREKYLELAARWKYNNHAKQRHEAIMSTQFLFFDTKSIAGFLFVK